MADEIKKRTENVEFGIDELTPPESVDYFIYRLETGRWKKAATAWMIAAIIVFVAFVVSNVLWIIYENQFEDEVITMTQEATTDGGGNAAVNGVASGNIYYGESETDNNNQEAGS